MMTFKMGYSEEEKEQILSGLRKAQDTISTLDREKLVQFFFTSQKGHWTGEEIATAIRERWDESAPSH